MKKLLISACSLILMAGCISDDRENFMVDDSFTLTNRQTLVGCSVHTGTYTVGVSKNGKGTSAATATLSTSAADAIASYNEANGTSFTALPEDSFTLSASSLEFAESDVVKEVTVTWDADKIAGIIGDSKNYVIPIRITSGGGIEANPDKSLVIIQLIRSSISIMQSNMSRSISRKSVEPDSLHTAAVDASDHGAALHQHGGFTARTGQSATEEVGGRAALHFNKCIPTVRCLDGIGSGNRVNQILRLT